MSDAELTPELHMNTIWVSWLRLCVEERCPDEYSIGEYFCAFMHATHRPEDFTPEMIERVKAHIRAKYPGRWSRYEALKKEHPQRKLTLLADEIA